MPNPRGLSINNQVWARRDSTGGSEWVLATVEGFSDGGARASSTVQVSFPGAKRRKRMLRTDIVPNAVKVVLKPLAESGPGVNRSKYSEDEIPGDDEITAANHREDKENRKRGRPGRPSKSKGREEKITIENDEGEEAEELTVNNEEVSEYEKIRLKNIAERQKMFAKLKSDMMALKRDMAPKPKPKTGVKRARNFLMYSSRKERVFTRSRRNSTGSSEASSGRSSGASTPIDKKRLWEEVSDSESEDEDVPKRSSVRNPNPSMWMKDPNINILMPEDVTDEMLANVADRVSDKVYSHDGTTCDQCRQETTDMKTLCRSGNCAGLRGYFCGVCLLNRYGQDARRLSKTQTGCVHRAWMSDMIVKRYGMWQPWFLRGREGGFELSIVKG